jgi:hypothetical protein
MAVRSISEVSCFSISPPLALTKVEARVHYKHLACSQELQNLATAKHSVFGGRGCVPRTIRRSTTLISEAFDLEGIVLLGRTLTEIEA